MRKKINVQPGDRYGRLVILKEVDPYVSKKGRPERRFECTCDCGSISIVALCHLRTGKIRSCGCLAIELRKNRLTTHGKCYIARLWSNIKTRAYSKTNLKYPRYGGRGITMSKEWINDCMAFIKYVKTTIGERPSKSHSLDRIDNDKGYEPGNLRWATPKEQAANRGNSVLITIEGNKYKLVDALKVCTPMVNENTLRHRLRGGWDPIKAFMTPLGARQGDYRKYGI